MANLPANFDWRNSPHHVSFLACFQKPNLPPSWMGNSLKESVQSAIERFIRDGVVQECELEEKVAHKFKVPDLKKLLIKSDEKGYGTKAELVAAAMRVAKDELLEKTAKVALYKCTPAGEVFVEECKVRKQEAENAAKNETHLQLIAGDPKTAVAAIVAFQRAYLDPKYSGSGWQVDQVRPVLDVKPKVIGELDEKSWRQLQAAAAMKMLWREEDEASWLPDGFETPIGDNGRALRIICTAARFRNLVLRDASWCKEVKLVFDQDNVDLCENCAALDGKIFNIKEIPEVPTEYCTSRDGCTCRLEAVRGNDEDDDPTITVTLDRESGEVIDDATDDPVEKLRQLKQMLDEGLIEQDEYQEKKKEILARM